MYSCTVDTWAVDLLSTWRLLEKYTMVYSYHDDDQGGENGCQSAISDFFCEICNEVILV